MDVLCVYSPTVKIEKGNAKCRNWSDLGWLWVTEDHWQLNHLIEHMIQFPTWL